MPSQSLQKSGICREKLVSLLLAVTMLLAVLPLFSTASAASVGSLNLGSPSVSSGTVTFPSATIGGSATYYAMIVKVDKGSIASTDYSTADLLENHQTAMWLFSGGKSTADVQTLLRSVKFSL